MQSLSSVLESVSVRTGSSTAEGPETNQVPPVFVKLPDYNQAAASFFFLLKNTDIILPLRHFLVSAIFFYFKVQ